MTRTEFFDMEEIYLLIFEKLWWSQYEGKISVQQYVEEQHYQHYWFKKKALNRKFLVIVKKS